MGVKAEVREEEEGVDEVGWEGRLGGIVEMGMGSWVGLRWMERWTVRRFEAARVGSGYGTGDWRRGIP